MDTSATKLERDLDPVSDTIDDGVDVWPLISKAQRSFLSGEITAEHYIVTANHGPSSSSRIEIQVQPKLDSSRLLTLASVTFLYMVAMTIFSLAAQHSWALVTFGLSSALLCITQLSLLIRRR